MTSTDLPPGARAVVEHLATTRPAGFVGTWLHGSATGGPQRPLELVSVVRSEVVPWRYPPTVDLLYGEWLRDAGTPRPHVAPDLAVLIAAARDTAVPLLGPPLAEVVDAVPPDDLRRAVLDCLPELLDDLVGDERNVLLTLARMVVTVRSGQVVPKDVAAEEVASELRGPTGRALRRAAAAYRGDVADTWGPVDHVAAALADLVRDRGGGAPARPPAPSSGGHARGAR